MESSARTAGVPAVSEWQPFDQAPKDGTRVLLWLSDEEFSVTAAWRVPPCYPEEDACWWSMEMDLDVEQFHSPTHWLPMPDGPARGQ
jgi:hypothetical protein